MAPSSTSTTGPTGPRRGNLAGSTSTWEQAPNADVIVTPESREERPLPLGWAKRALSKVASFLTIMITWHLFRFFLRGLNQVECHNQEALVDAILNRGDRGLLTVSNRMSVSNDPGLWSVLVPFWRTGMEKMRWSMCTDDIYYANPYLKNIFVAGKTLPIKRNRGMEQPLFKERMSVLPAIMGLPEGIHQRDDAFTKAEAVLTHVPDLE